MIVIDIASLYHLFVPPVILFFHISHSRWMVIHESVRKVIDGIKIYGSEVPRFMMHDGRGCTTDCGAFCDDSGQSFDSPVFFLIDLGKVGNEIKDKPNI